MYTNLRLRNNLIYGSLALAVLVVASCNKGDSTYLPRIVIKFEEGIDVSIKDNQFRQTRGKSINKPGPLDKPNDDKKAISQQLIAINNILERIGDYKLVPLFGDIEAPLEKVDETKEGSLNIDRYFSVVLTGAQSSAAIQKLVSQIAKLEIVTTAYEAEVGSDPGIVIPTEQ